ncbi:hypothetical protein BXZ70DRAFT_729667 [Cristinia sonorae]|uniref:Uncharacterized protein n=1 Tax=Cristinia sonorae TaxID=1940300 RepID=A0A8K0XSA1_9AGAR|nr:hypothetical protein BXZ70DRAFT_729667 [Cristinia sonorae]
MNFSRIAVPCQWTLQSRVLILRVWVSGASRLGAECLPDSGPSTHSLNHLFCSCRLHRAVWSAVLSYKVIFFRNVATPPPLGEELGKSKDCIRGTVGAERYAWPTCGAPIVTVYVTKQTQRSQFSPSDV